MVDIFRFTEIAEHGAPILNPLSHEKLMRLGELANLSAGTTVLDLGSGKGEMLIQWAARHGIRGHGIEIHPVFVDEAIERARQLGVEDAVSFAVGDAGAHNEGDLFEVVSCLGASWIGGGFSGTIDLMRRSLKPGGRLLVGEPFLIDSAPTRVAGEHPGLSNLVGVLDKVEEAELELTEMVVASQEDWDIYQSRHWATATEWLKANPRHHEADQVKAMVRHTRRNYLSGRGSLAWAVFILEQLD